MYIAVSGLFNDYHELPQVMDEVDTLMNNKFYETGRYIFSDNVSEDTPVLVQIDEAGYQDEGYHIFKNTF